MYILFHETKYQAIFTQSENYGTVNICVSKYSCTLHVPFLFIQAEWSHYTSYNNWSSAFSISGVLNSVFSS